MCVCSLNAKEPLCAEETAKCVPCAKGSSHGCMPADECHRECKVQYECQAVKKSGGSGWNWQCVEQPFVAGRSVCASPSSPRGGGAPCRPWPFQPQHADPSLCVCVCVCGWSVCRSAGQPKEDCEEQCVGEAQDRYGCHIEGKTAEAAYSCLLLDPHWVNGTTHGVPNPAGTSISLCNGTNGFQDPESLCAPRYTCHQQAGGPDESATDPQSFDYKCVPSNPPVGGAPWGGAQSLALDQRSQLFHNTALQTWPYLHLPGLQSDIAAAGWCAFVYRRCAKLPPVAVHGKLKPNPKGVVSTKCATEVRVAKHLSLRWRRHVEHLSSTYRTPVDLAFRVANNLHPKGKGAPFPGQPPGVCWLLLCVCVCVCGGGGSAEGPA